MNCVHIHEVIMAHKMWKNLWTTFDDNKLYHKIEFINTMLGNCNMVEYVDKKH